MTKDPRQSGPLVSILMSTYNRPAYVRQALDSILQQTYPNIEVVLVRDGGCDIGDIKAQYNDSRLLFIDRSENRGLPVSFNEALRNSTGKYVCYLGDDDILYPHHVETLVNAIEGQDRYGVVYSDLYKVHCRILPDGRRMVLSKNIEISRDFDRTTMLQFNHVLHVSMIHRRDLLEKTGYYNEKLNVLIDWDLTRRLAFFTDFKHVRQVTGEFYAPVGDCDRISVRKRKNIGSYILNLLTIRSTRPQKPWLRLKDMAVIVLADGLDWQLDQSLREIWSHGFWPYSIYLPLCEAQLRNLKTVVPNITGIAVDPHSTAEQRIDEVLRHIDTEFVCIVPSSYRIAYEEVAWVEKCIHPFVEHNRANIAFELPEARPGCWGVVLHRSDLNRARHNYGNLPLRDSMIASGMEVRKPALDEWPFQFENMVTLARQLEKLGDWKGAAKAYELTKLDYDNGLWMDIKRANALYHAGLHDQSLDLIRQINDTRQTVSTLLIEARNHYIKEDFLAARRQLQKASEILGHTGLEQAQNLILQAEDMLFTDNFPPPPEEPRQDAVNDDALGKDQPFDEEEMNKIKDTLIPDNGWTQHYDVVKELGDCHAMLGDYRQAQECYDQAAVLCPDEAGPYVGSGVIALQKGRLEDAEVAFRVAVRLDPDCSKAFCGMAMISQQRNQTEEAFELYMKSLDLDSNNLTALLGLFQLACRTGSFSKVIHYLEVYLDRHPADISVMFCLATLHLKEARPAEAKQLLERILILDSEHTEAANLLEEVEHSLAQ